MYLKAHQPDLGIDNPYELDDQQFNAAVDLLKQQQPNVGEYWSDAAKQIQSFANGDVVVGTTWQYQYFALLAENAPVAASPASQGFLPEEGATGWSDTWMISSQAAASELHVQVDEFHRLADGQRRGRAVLRRGARAEQVLRRRTTLSGGRKADGYPAGPEVLRQLPRRGPGFLEERLLLDHSGGGLRR